MSEQPGTTPTLPRPTYEARQYHFAQEDGTTLILSWRRYIYDDSRENVELNLTRIAGNVVTSVYQEKDSNTVPLTGDTAPVVLRAILDGLEDIRATTQAAATDQWPLPEATEPFTPTPVCYEQEAGRAVRS